MPAMRRWTGPTACAAIVLACVAAAPAAPAPPLTEQPATIRVQIAPESVEPGGQARVTVTLDPAEGVKVNRYPKIRLEVPARPGLLAGGSATLGDDRPPAIDQTGGNYFDEIQPLTLALDLERGAPSGSHEIEGQLVFYYCVTKSGFCAPKKSPVKFALNVR
jgi:hypothetical protein